MLCYIKWGQLRKKLACQHSASTPFGSVTYKYRLKLNKKGRFISDRIFNTAPLSPSVRITTNDRCSLWNWNHVTGINGCAKNENCSKKKQLCEHYSEKLPTYLSVPVDWFYNTACNPSIFTWTWTNSCKIITTELNYIFPKLGTNVVFMAYSWYDVV